MILDIVLLTLALGGLVAGAECLIRGAIVVAKRLGMSSFFIGLTIVGFGTSAPELATSAGASLSGNADIAVGNVVGSNIFNLAVILGIGAIIFPVAVNTRLVRTQLFVMIACAFVPYGALLTAGVMNRPTGLIMIAALFAFLALSYRADRAEGESTEEIERELERELRVGERAALARNIGLIGVGLALLVGCAHLLVVSSVNIATDFGVSELVIGLTIVSMGTSAPELITSVVAAVRKQSDISFGNILGSNVFNVLGIGGVTAVLGAPELKPQLLQFDLPVLCVLSIASFPIVWTGQRISRIEGIALVGVYAAYIAALFWLAPGWFPAN